MDSFRCLLGPGGGGGNSLGHLHTPIQPLWKASGDCLELSARLTVGFWWRRLYVEPQAEAT